MSLSKSQKVEDFNAENQKTTQVIDKFKQKARFKDYVIVTFWFAEMPEAIPLDKTLVEYYSNKLANVGSLETTKKILAGDRENLNEYLDIIKHNLYLVGKDMKNYELPVLGSTEDYINHMDEVINKFSKIKDNGKQIGEKVKAVVLDFIKEYVNHATDSQDAEALKVLRTRLNDSLNQKYNST